MTTLIRPDNKQPAPYITSRNGHFCLRTDCITPSVRWFTEKAIDAVNPIATCAEPPVVTCTAITLWRPTIELPIWELGYFREGSKEKAIPGVNLLTSNVRIVLTLPVAA